MIQSSFPACACSFPSAANCLHSPQLVPVALRRDPTAADRRFRHRPCRRVKFARSNTWLVFRGPECPRPLEPAVSSSSSPHHSSPDYRQPVAAAVKLTLKEVQSAFAPLAERFGPILSLEQAAELAGYTSATLK